MPPALSRKSPTTLELKVVAIGNSRGVRLPKAILERYAIKDALVLEAREEGLLLRVKADKRLSWAESYREMARESEQWHEFDTAIADGLGRNEKW